MVRTRELLIDVARQLFARQGVAATTMNDIAEASGKGRRTIYTYFKNKEVLFDAVVSSVYINFESAFIRSVGGAYKPGFASRREVAQLYQYPFGGCERSCRA